MIPDARSDNERNTYVRTVGITGTRSDNYSQ